MKKSVFLFLLMISSMVWYSCGNGSTADSGDSLKGSPDQSLSTNELEQFLSIKDEKQLIEKFGASHVTYDTIWGAEGNFGFGSYIDKGTVDEVQLFWNDSATRSGVGGVSVYAYADQNNERHFTGKWRSHNGVKLGMTATELENLNGNPFIFSGVGWDYGGTVTDWKGGKLDNQGFGVQLDYDYSKEASETELDAITGDKDVSSNEPAVKKIGVKVVSISVYKPL